MVKEKGDKGPERGREKGKEKAKEGEEKGGMWSPVFQNVVAYLQDFTVMHARTRYFILFYLFI